MASYASWQDAIEHVHSHADGLPEILRRTDPHKVSGPLLIERPKRGIKHLDEHLFWLANAEPADGKAVNGRVIQAGCRPTPTVCVEAALANPEQQWTNLDARVDVPFKRGYISRQPPLGQIQGLNLVRFGRLVSGADVQHHTNIGSKLTLDINSIFRAQPVGRTVNVRAEQDSIVVERPLLSQTEDLKSAGVGQNGTVPSHESGDPAEFLNDLPARSQHEVIRIGKNDLRARVPDVGRI